jgi:hypothetical protein
MWQIFSKQCYRKLAVAAVAPVSEDLDNLDKNWTPAF